MESEGIAAAIVNHQIFIAFNEVFQVAQPDVGKLFDFRGLVDEVNTGVIAGKE